MIGPGRDFYPRISIVVPMPVPARFRQRSSNGGRALLIVRPDEVAWMVRQLRGRGWRSGTDLGARSGGQKRKLKAIVEAANGAILHFPGSPGFMLAEEATRAQIRRGIVQLRAEARRPLARAASYRRILRGRVTPVTGQLFPVENNNPPPLTAAAG